MECEHVVVKYGRGSRQCVWETRSTVRTLHPSSVVVRVLGSGPSVGVRVRRRESRYPVLFAWSWCGYFWYTTILRGEPREAVFDEWR